MAVQTRASGAESKTQCDFLLPDCGAGQKKVGNICASNEQDKRDGAEQNEQRRFDVADDVLMQGSHNCADAGIGLGVLLLQASGDGCHLRLRLCQGHARFHPCDHLQVMIAALTGFLGVECNRYPELIPPRWKLKGSWHHAYDGEAFAIQINRFPNNTGIETKPSLPQSMADDDDVIAARLIFLGAKTAA